MRSHKKFRPDMFSRFDVYWIQINKTVRQAKYIYRLCIWGTLHPSTILTFNCGFICEHLPFVQYKTKIKKIGDFIIFFHAFSNFYKNKQLLNTNIFIKVWWFINLPWGHLRSHNFFLPDWFSRFDNFWAQTNRQTEKINI